MIKALSTERGGLQVPGDCNQDRKVDLADGLCLFAYLFQAERASLPCGDGSIIDPANLLLLDWNGDGGINITDGVGVLAWLFSSGPPHPAFTDVDQDGKPDAVPIVGCPDPVG